MRTEISLIVTPAVRRRLKAVAGNRNSPQKHVWRAKIILLSAAGIGTHEIMRQTGTSKTCVCRWQERFMRKALMGCCATRRGPHGFRRWRRKSSNGSWRWKYVGS